MSKFHDAMPSSLRRPVEQSAFLADGLPQVESPKHNVVPRALPTPPFARLVMKSRFARLPQEPEDAKMTGVTRSLQRRLLALNVGGTLLRGSVGPNPKIA